MEKYLTAETLPPDWEDNIGNNPYLKKKFLKLIEQFDSSEKHTTFSGTQKEN